MFAAVPFLPMSGAAFATRADWCASAHGAAQGLGAGHLLPTFAGIEFLCVAAGEHLERRRGMMLIVDVAPGVLVSKPIGRHEVRDEYVAEGVAVLIILDRIADLSRPKHASRILIGTIEPGIDCHFADLMRCTDADTGFVRLDRLDEDFGDGSPSLVRS